MIRLTSLLAEVTDMTFLVAKTAKPQDKASATKAVEYLRRQGLPARVKYPAAFDKMNRKEPWTWGVWTTKDAERKALSLLKRAPHTDTGLVLADLEEEVE